MAVATRIDRIEHVRYVEFAGTLTDDDVVSSYAIVSNPAGDPTMDLIVDTSLVDRVHATGSQLEAIAAKRARDAARNVTGPLRVAIVAPSDAVYGMARLYVSHRDGGTSRYHICRTIFEAREWLGFKRAHDERVISTGHLQPPGKPCLARVPEQPHFLWPFVYQRGEEP